MNRSRPVPYPARAGAALLALACLAATGAAQAAAEGIACPPADSSSFGAGWPGTNGVPTLATSAPPVLGSTIDIQLGSASNATECACLFLAGDTLTIPTQFGGSLLVPPFAVVPLPTLPPSGASIPAPIPNEARLCGFGLFLQFVHTDPGASHGIAFSNGLALTFGLPLPI